MARSNASRLLVLALFALPANAQSVDVAGLADAAGLGQAPGVKQMEEVRRNLRGGDTAAYRNILYLYNELGSASSPAEIRRLSLRLKEELLLSFQAFGPDFRSTGSQVGRELVKIATDGRLSRWRKLNFDTRSETEARARYDRLRKLFNGPSMVSALDEIIVELRHDIGLLTAGPLGDDRRSAESLQKVARALQAVPFQDYMQQNGQQVNGTSAGGLQAKVQAGSQQEVVGDDLPGGSRFPWERPANTAMPGASAGSGASAELTVGAPAAAPGAAPDGMPAGGMAPGAAGPAPAGGAIAAGMTPPRYPWERPSAPGMQARGAMPGAMGSASAGPVPPGAMPPGTMQPGAAAGAPGTMPPGMMPPGTAAGAPGGMPPGGMQPGAAAGASSGMPPGGMPPGGAPAMRPEADPAVHGEEAEEAEEAVLPATPDEGWQLHAIMGTPGDRKVVLAVPGQQHAWIGAEGERIAGSAYRLHSLNAAAAGGWVRLDAVAGDERPMKIYRDGRKEYELVEVQPTPRAAGGWGAPPALAGTGPAAGAKVTSVTPATAGFPPPVPAGLGAGIAGAGTGTSAASATAAGLAEEVVSDSQQMVDSHQIEGPGSAIRYVGYVDFDGLPYARLEVARGGVSTGLLRKAGDPVADSDFQIAEVRPEYLLLRSRNRSAGLKLHRTTP